MDSEVVLTKSRFRYWFGKVGLWLPVAIALVVAVLAIIWANLSRSAPYEFQGLLYDPIRPAVDFELIDQNFQPFRLSDQQGKYVFLYFGYISCPDACPLTLGTWNQISRELGGEAGQMRFVLITVDPARDTPEKLKKYVSIFKADIVGLSGSLDDTEYIAQSYNASFRISDVETAAGYLVNHTTLIYLIDPEGQLLLAYPHTVDASVILADLEHLMN